LDAFPPGFWWEEIVADIVGSPWEGSP
jgi:hypothetical protein